MKSLMLFFSLVLLFSTSHAVQVGDIRLDVKILSFDKHWVQVETSGKKVKIPRVVFKGHKIKSGDEREIGLTRNQFNLMQLRMAQAPAKNTKTK